MSELQLSSINITGPDAFEFLQNQLTADIRQLESEAEVLSAWCSPKGRVIWFGTVQSTDAGYALSALSETASGIVERMKVFRFRSKVEFGIDENTGTVDAGFLIQNGYPYIGQEQSEKFTPHMLNLDQLGAVSLDKGCFPGQEIVARTHYRGKTKRRLFRFESDKPVSPGDKVSDGKRDVGEVVNAVGTDLLAVVPTESANSALTCGDATLSPVS